MSENKYEYLLHTWGGFYNKQFKDIHGKEEGFFFFDTKEERQKYIDELESIKEDLNASTVMIVLEEGTHVRYRTIAILKCKYKDKEYDFEYDFGNGYQAETAEYMFTDGNYSCVCNLSGFIREKYGPDSIPELKCGSDDLEVLSLEIELRK